MRGSQQARFGQTGVSHYFLLYLVGFSSFLWSTSLWVQSFGQSQSAHPNSHRNLWIVGIFAGLCNAAIYSYFFFFISGNLVNSHEFWWEFSFRHTVSAHFSPWRNSCWTAAEVLAFWELFRGHKTHFPNQSLCWCPKGEPMMKYPLCEWKQFVFPKFGLRSQLEMLFFTPNGQFNALVRFVFKGWDIFTMQAQRSMQNDLGHWKFAKEFI